MGNLTEGKKDAASPLDKFTEKPMKLAWIESGRSLNYIARIKIMENLWDVIPYRGYREILFTVT